MRKLIAVVGLMSVSLSALAQTDMRRTIHFAAQEIGMQIRYEQNMNLNAMCFVVGSTGHARAELNSALFKSEASEAVEQMGELAAQISVNVTKLASLCDDNGKVNFNTAAQPVYTNLDKKPSIREVSGLLKQISDNANKIVDINLGVKTKASVADCDEVNGEGMICIGK